MAISRLRFLNFFSPQTPLIRQESESCPPQQVTLSPSTHPIYPLHLRSKTLILVPTPLPLLKHPLRNGCAEETEFPFRDRHESESLSVIFPSLGSANTLFFRSAYNVQVIVGDDEPEDRLISRFRREVLRAGVIQECKRRRVFESSQEKRKRKTREAARRNRKSNDFLGRDVDVDTRERRPQPKVPRQVKEDAPKKKAEDFGEDNWEFFDVELPYC